LVVAIDHRIRNEIAFYNLAHPDPVPRLVPGGFAEQRLAVSPNGELVAASSMAASSMGGQVLLFDAAMGTLTNSLDGHLTAALGIAFSPDGRRLVSTAYGREAVKLWDVGTGQELLTLAGTDLGLGKARWSADGDAILAGSPWQAWSAPSWEEIAAQEAKDSPSSDLGGQGKRRSSNPEREAPRR
jgi:WD40 repeat protein